MAVFPQFVKLDNRADPKRLRSAKDFLSSIVSQLSNRIFARSVIHEKVHRRVRRRRIANRKHASSGPGCRTGNRFGIELLQLDERTIEKRPDPSPINPRFTNYRSTESGLKRSIFRNAHLPVRDLHYVGAQHGIQSEERFSGFRMWHSFLHGVWNGSESGFFILVRVIRAVRGMTCKARAALQTVLASSSGREFIVGSGFG